MTRFTESGLPIIDNYIYNLFADLLSRFMNPLKLNNTLEIVEYSNQDDNLVIGFEEIFNGVFSVYFLGLIISITVLVIELIIIFIIEF